MDKAKNAKTNSAIPPKLYDDIAKCTHAYFGPDASRYIARLITIHTYKQPESICREDLIGLYDWIKGAATYFAEDKESVERYMTHLLELATSSDSA